MCVQKASYTQILRDLESSKGIDDGLWWWYCLVSTLTAYFSFETSERVKNQWFPPILSICAVWADFGLDLAQICIFGQLWAALQPCKYLKHPIKYILAKNISLGDYFFCDFIVSISELRPYGASQWPLPLKMVKMAKNRLKMVKIATAAPALFKRKKCTFSSKVRHPKFFFF